MRESSRHETFLRIEGQKLEEKEVSSTSKPKFENFQVSVGFILHHLGRHTTLSLGGR